MRPALRYERLPLITTYLLTCFFPLFFQDVTSILRTLKKDFRVNEAILRESKAGLASSLSSGRPTSMRPRRQRGAGGSRRWA
ncbi:hypothetical protein B0H17DRAFT_646680 [Mycena rosella]|uniref:Uncharacterized protein n=1 Tax=Mycena rosella TaxID=1033263 RepID=A0AAD7DDV3_MYCRO|nr:hypothetical protein B0H17DRAFT_646680 [Mycena rosella]